MSTERISGQGSAGTFRFALLGLGILAVLAIIIVQGHQPVWGLRGYPNGDTFGYFMGAHMGGGRYATSNYTGFRGNMHGYMMGSSGAWDEPELTKDEALRIAQDYIVENLPGATVQETSVEYPYMFVVVQDDVAVGMLMVNGVDGDVLYHEWGPSLSSMMRGCW